MKLLSFYLLQWIVRKEAMTNLARLYRKVMSRYQDNIIIIIFIYSLVYSDDETLDQTDYDRIQWIPNKLFHCFYLTTPEDR